MIGVQEATLPILGGSVLVQPLLEVVIPMPAGGLGLPISVPADTSLCGTVGLVQIFELDPGAVLGLSFSRGLRLLLGI